MATQPEVFEGHLSDDKKTRRGRFWRGLCLSLLLLAACGGAYATLTKHGRETAQLVGQGFVTAYAMKTNPDLVFQQAGGDHVNVLLIGRDVNWKPSKVYDPKTKTYRPFHVHDESAQARSDTMILVSLDKSRNTIRMVSLPRDAMVRMPENDFGVRRSKLNAAHAYGGPPLLIRTLHDELGITIHHYAVIKFEGFKKLIDQVGGITVKVDGALKRDRSTGKLYRGNLKYDDNWGNLHIDLKPGVQKLDGEQAHNYVRFRMDLEGDPGRIRRQQTVMRALAKQIMHASPFAIPGLVKEVRRQFETDLNDEQIGSMAAFAKSIGDSAKIQPLTLFGAYGRRGSVILNKPLNQKLLATILGPTFDSDKFLQNSPYTETGDEIGASNNASPAARAVLREAGLLKGNNDLKRPSELDAPVRVEPSESDNEARALEAAVEETRNYRSSSRLAASDDEVVVERSATQEERPRRRRRRVTSVETSTQIPVSESPNSSSSPSPERSSGSSASGERSSESAQELSNSPVPVPESNDASTLQVEESPVPQPE
ncbi:MAG TPA: LCP family protein [Abditibacteriaceae bacterium]